MKKVVIVTMLSAALMLNGVSVVNARTLSSQFGTTVTNNSTVEQPSQPVQQPTQPAPTVQQPYNTITTTSRFGSDRVGFQVPASQPTTTSPTHPESPTSGTGGSTTPNYAMPAAPAGLTADEARVFEMVNEFRIQNGQAPVNINMKLVELARLKAQDMVDNKYFGHVSPTYGTAGQMARAAGIQFNRIGENLSSAGNATQAQVQLMYSTKGHREIMLRSQYNEVGIGIVKLKNTPGIMLVQIFIETK
jgi:uncharacterized protein YkwD